MTLTVVLVVVIVVVVVGVVVVMLAGVVVVVLPGVVVVVLAGVVVVVVMGVVVVLMKMGVTEGTMVGAAVGIVRVGTGSPPNPSSWVRSSSSRIINASLFETN